MSLKRQAVQHDGARDTLSFSSACVPGRSRPWGSLRSKKALRSQRQITQRIGSMQVERPWAPGTTSRAAWREDATQLVVTMSASLWRRSGPASSDHGNNGFR